MGKMHILSALGAAVAAVTIAAGPSPGADLFPDKAVVKYAKGFTLRYFKSFKVVEVINPFSHAPDTTRYVLVPRGKPTPPEFAKATRVDIPIRTVICLSTTHISLLDFLGAIDRIVGMSDTARLVNPKVLARARAGQIVEVGRDETLNEERVLTLAPDLLMTVGFTGKDIGSHRTLMESGIAVLANSEWMENSVLGRMEWVKLVGAFLDRDGIAERKFDSLEAEYGKVKRLAASARNRPKVIGGTSRKGVWTVPGGRSYVAGLLRDAGAEFPFADDTTSGIRNLGFETVYRAGVDADFWLNAEGAKSLKDIEDEDERYRDFKAFKANRVFSNTKRMAPNGSNDYWESGVVNPHLLLSDLVKVLHPELLPDYRLYYTKALE
ncbi:MAG: ABC transporter substrate-binding protein [Fibrobacteres bacterium]|nr:ABC transporter substrate-binding protein [Fibrobacterota bacterium]